MKKRALLLTAIILTVGLLLCACGGGGGTPESSEQPSAPVEESSPPPAEEPSSPPVEESSEPPEESPPDAAKAGDGLTFGFLFCGLDTPSVKAGQEAAEARAAELGINLLVMDGKFDAQTQTDQALNLISQQVDGIIINPNDAEAFVPVAKQIKDAGIPLLAWVQPLPAAADDCVLTFIGPDDTAAGKTAIEVLKSAFPDATEPIKVVEIKGALNSIAAQKRAQGLEDALAASDDFELLETQATESWARDEAMVIMENYLAKYDKIDAVYCHDDNIAGGAIEAIKAVERTGEMKVIGVNGEPAAFDAIKAGDQYATLVQHIRAGAARCMDVLVGINKGETFEKWEVDDWEPVTSENVNDVQPAWD